MENIELEKLSTKQFFGYTIGAIPASLLAFIFYLKYIEFFYNDLGLLPIYFIIGQIIYMTVNALNDPLMGQLSDRTNREKWGSRRIIYLKYGGPVWAFSFVLIWFPWSYNNQFIMFLHYVITICLFDTFYTLVILAWTALLPEMTMDTDERSKVSFFVVLFGFFALLPFFLILGTMKVTSFSFQFIIILLAIISSILIFIVSKICNEKPEYQRDEYFPLLKSIKESFKLRSFIIYLGFNFFTTAMVSIGISYIFVYLFILGDNRQIALFYFFLIFVIFGFGGNIICMKLRPKWGIRKIILRFGFIKTIGMFTIFILILIPTINSLSILLLWIAFIISMIFGGYGVFGAPLMFLSADEDEVNHGTRREGMLLGMSALFTKPAQSLGPIIATLILVYFGYIQGSDTQSASALFGIKILFLLVPPLMVAISLIFIYFYPLDGEKLKDMQQKLESLHKEKRQKFENI